MKTFVRSLSFLLLSLCFLTSANGAAVDQLAQDLMVKSGLDNQIQQVPLLVQAGMAQAQQEAGGLPEDLLKEWNSITASAFDPAILREGVLKQIKAELGVADMKAVLDWLDSPAGRKITQMEESASTPEAYAEMRAMADKPQDPRLSGRMERLQRLDPRSTQRKQPSA